MYGYASSADASGNCICAEITVFFADDTEFDESGCPKEVYRYNREHKTIDKIYPVGEPRFGIPYDTVDKVYQMLRAEELKFDEARRIKWRNAGFERPELLKSERLAEAWLPLPVINGNCRCMCINVTSCFFTRVPKPLEVSMLCDMLNLGFMKTGIRIATPFYNCFNSVYCSVDFAGVALELCGLDFTAAVRDLTHKQLVQKELHKFPRHKLNRKRIAEVLRADKIPEPRFRGNEHSFAVDIKRECMAYAYSYIADSVSACDPAPIIGIADFVTKEVGRFKILSEVFALGGNIYSASDILYLTLYELMSAFAFHEDRLNLKKKIANSKARQAALGKVAAPALIMPNGEVI